MSARLMPKYMQARYQVGHQPGKGYVVLDPQDRAVSEPTAFRKAAEAACARLQAEADAAAGRGPRACLCCGVTFDSDGIHNRMCNACRGRDDALSAYGYAGAGAGRKPRRSAGA